MKLSLNEEQIGLICVHILRKLWLIWSYAPIEQADCVLVFLPAPLQYT